MNGTGKIVIWNRYAELIDDRRFKRYLIEWLEGENFHEFPFEVAPISKLANLARKHVEKFKLIE
jgi:hypothetical protein